MENPKFISKVKLTSQGQITLPQEARSDLNIDNGAELYWYEVNGHLILVNKLVNQEDLLKNMLTTKLKSNLKKR